MEHVLRNGSFTTASEDIREFVLIYEGRTKKLLLDAYIDLHSQSTSLIEQETALIELQTELQRLKTALEGEGTLRWNRTKHQCLA